MLKKKLKYLTNFQKTLEILLCKRNVLLTWSANCDSTNSTGAETFVITDTMLYVPVVTLSTHDNEKLLKELESRFK